MQTVIKSESAEDSAALHDDVEVKLERSGRERVTELNELYAEHEVKEELVIGPVLLQKPGPSAELVLRDVGANSSELKHPSLCGLCGQGIASSSSLTQHKCTRAANASSCDLEEQGVPIATKFTCDICKGDFKLKMALTQHILHTHNFNDKSKTLLTCGIRKQFTQRKLFTSPRKLNYPIKINLFPCSFCDKKFAYKSSLTIHERTHTGDKPFSCTICKKRFSRSSNVTLHQNIHSGDKPYSCKVCNKQFSHSQYLARHQTVHSGDKPYSCKICSKQFSKSSALSMHQNVHSDNKPYPCKICNKQFSYSWTLKRHQRGHNQCCQVSGFSTKTGGLVTPFNGEILLVVASGI